MNKSELIEYVNTSKTSNQTTQNILQPKYLKFTWLNLTLNITLKK